MTTIRPKRKRRIRRPKRKERKNLHFRDMDSTRFSIGSDILPEEFCEFVNDEIWPHLMIGEHKTQKRRQLTIRCVHALISTGLVNRVVADDRDWHVTGAKARCKVWDALIAAGFARMSLGSEESGKVTRYAATATLLRLRKVWELRLLVDLNLKRNTKCKKPTKHALVVLHKGKIDLSTGQPLEDVDVKRPLPLRGEIADTWPQLFVNEQRELAIRCGLDYWRIVENSLNAINRKNLRHSWIAFNDDGIAFQPNPCLRQIHCGKFFRGARLYSWSQVSGQNLSKETRRRMLIDEEATVEWDFSCLHIRMLYHLMELNPKGDLYRPEMVFPTLWAIGYDKEQEIVRDFLKRATNILLNTSSRGKANSAVGLLVKDHKEARLLRQVIKEVEGTSPKGVVQRIVDCHPDVAEFFFCETETGMQLMGIDGAMMHTMLNEFVLNHRKPVLAIHDAFVVRRSDAKKARLVMSETYQKFCGFPPSIHRAF
jgi:hypothetical protein